MSPLRDINKEFHREASTIKSFVSLKFDVAKLKEETRENKKSASTAHFHKHLINNILRNRYLYNNKKGKNRT